MNETCRGAWYEAARGVTTVTIAETGKRVCFFLVFSMEETVTAKKDKAPQADKSDSVEVAGDTLSEKELGTLIGGTGVPGAGTVGLVTSPNVGIPSSGPRFDLVDTITGGTLPDKTKK